jgi:hypothetical protein
MDNRFASIHLNKKVRGRTPREAVVLLLHLLLRVGRLESRINKHSGNSNKAPSAERTLRFPAIWSEYSTG